MSKYHEILRPFLSEVRLDDLQEFSDTLCCCGELLDCWPLHGLNLKTLRRYRSKKARANAYIGFDIPKKSGGIRHIAAPVNELKTIQKALNLMLQVLIEPSPEAMGFVPGRSVLTNATTHLGQAAVINCDIKDFFPSITKTMVRRALTESLSPFTPSREVINMMSNLVTAPRPDGVEALPQGAPTSPVVSNLVFRPIDRRITRLADKIGFRYTRYADDLTLSCQTNDFSRCRHLIGRLSDILQSNGLTLNPSKTRILRKNSRMEVTGLTVGDKVNVSRRYVKQLRTLLHLWETRGLDEAQLIYTRDFSHSEVNISKVINGKLNYLLMIKGPRDSTYRRLKSRFRQLLTPAPEHLIVPPHRPPRYIKSR